MGGLDDGSKYTSTKLSKIQTRANAMVNVQEEVGEVVVSTPH